MGWNGIIRKAKGNRSMSFQEEEGGTEKGMNGRWKEKRQIKLEMRQGQGHLSEKMLAVQMWSSILFTSV